MTCIVGVKTDTGVLLAGDSLGSAGYHGRVRADIKVFRLTPEIACGFTSSYRMGQILRFHVEPPCIHGDLYEWAVREFIPVVRAAFKEHGYSTIQNNEESGGTFLVAVRDRLFQVEDDFQVAESVWDFDACGCGDAYAMGAMWSLRAAKLKPRQFLTKALDAAVEFSGGVRGPYTFAATRAD